MIECRTKGFVLENNNVLKGRMGVMNFLKNPKKKEKLVEYMYAIAGCLIYSVGFNMLIVPMGLYSGGFMGLSQLVNWVVVNPCGVSIPESFNFVGILFFIINVPLFYMAFKIMSKAYAIKSLISVVFLTVAMSIIPIPTTPVIEDYLTAAIIGGIVCGVGGGFILCGRMAGGGQDIIGVCCAKKYPNFSVGKVSIFINLIIYGFCFFIYDIEMVVYSLIFATVYAVAVDKIHVRNINMSAMIFTKKTGIAKAVMEEMGRGVTDWVGEGAYTEEPSYVLYIVLSKYEVAKLKEIVHRVDPHAFVIFTEGCSVEGNFEKRL